MKTKQSGLLKFYDWTLDGGENDDNLAESGGRAAVRELVCRANDAFIVARQKADEAQAHVRAACQAYIRLPSTQRAHANDSIDYQAMLNSLTMKHRLSVEHEYVRHYYDEDNPHDLYVSCACGEDVHFHWSAAEPYRRKKVDDAEDATDAKGRC